jgi:hypothetical protein
MLLAWSTLVVLVLLLPGFLFFAGLYRPERISHDSAPVSPIGQLAGIVGVAFALHAGAYLVINGALCRLPALDAGCVHLHALFAVLRLENAASSDFASLRQMFDTNMLRIALYFAALSAMGYFIGVKVGHLIEAGPLRTFARVPWVFELASNASGAESTYQLVQAHVLTKTSYNGKSLLYQGVVIDFRVAVDGAIKNIVLKNARSALLDISSDTPIRRPLVLPLAQAHHATEFLVLGAADIVNVYLEKVTPVEASAAELRQLDEELRKEGI